MVLLWIYFSLYATYSYEGDALRAYKPGDVMLGGLIPVHLEYENGHCTKLYSPGVGLVETIIYYIDKINKDQTLLPNITLGYDIQDYCNSRSLAMTYTYDYVRNNSHPIAAMVGPTNSGISLLVASLLHVRNLAAVSPSATSEELSQPFYSTFFRTISPDDRQAKAIADIIDYFNWTYIAAVAIDDSYGRNGVKALEQEAYARNTFCIAFTDYYSSSGHKNKIRSILARIRKQSNIKVIVLWTTGYNFVEEAARLNLTGRTFLVSESIAERLKDKDTFNKYGTVLDGCIGVLPREHNVPDFQSYLQEMTPDDTVNSSNPFWGEFWKLEFDCSVEEFSKETCRDKMEQHAIFQKLYTVYVPYLIDAVYAIAHALQILFDTKGFNATSAHNGFQVEPIDVTDALFKANFLGVTGIVRFNKNGDPRSTTYDIVNLQKYGDTSRVVRIATWELRENGKMLHNMNASAIRWQSQISPFTVPKSECMEICRPGTLQTTTVGCCWDCIPCPEGTVSKEYGSRNCTECPINQKASKDQTDCFDLPINNPQWTDISSIIIIILTILAVLVCVYCFAEFVKHRETPLVKASNRELSYILISSIIACLILPFLHLWTPTDLICRLIQPWRFISYTLVVSVLFLKTMRVVCVFNVYLMTKWFKEFVVNVNLQILAIVTLNILEIVVSICWLFLDPPFMHERVYHQDYRFLSCMPYKTITGKILQSILFCYLILMSLLSSFYAFKVRNMPENFNEAKHVGFSLYILLLSWLLYYPVDLAVEGWYVGLVSCSAILFSCYGLLVCIFIPKLYIIVLHPDRNTMDSMKNNVRHYCNRTSTIAPSAKDNKATNSV